MSLSKEQAVAYDMILKWIHNRDKWYFKLGGYGGTGKSYLLQHLINNYQGTLWAVAPTGKAASVLGKKLKGTPVTTIHQLIYKPVPPNKSKVDDLETRLQDQPDDKELQDKYTDALIEYNNDTVNFVYREENGLEAGELVIVDEASMVPEYVMNDLRATGCFILFVGDPGQLPPVNSKDWFRSVDFDYVLTEVQRQALDSPIIRLSMDIRQGKSYHGKYNEPDCRVVGKPDVKVSELMKCDQIITGMNASRQNLNRLMRKKFKFEGHLPNKGEKLICLKNEVADNMNYINGVQCVTTSGDADDFGEHRIDIEYEGYVRRNILYYKYHCLSTYDDTVVESPWYERKGMREFDYGYAITCHKSQGSEWDNVIIIDDKMMRQDREFRKRWLYTAVTRASKQVTLVQ